MIFITILYCTIRNSWKVFLSSLLPLFQNELSRENEFDLHENELIYEKHFHLNGLACRLVLTKRQKGNSEIAYSVILKDKEVFSRPLCHLHKTFLCGEGFKNKLKV